MKIIHLTGLAMTAGTLFLSSCASNEDLEDRLEKRNDSYGSFQDRREIRQDSRQDRTDAWFDRAMH